MLTTIEPSPMADATRFPNPCRTSPTANTPGRPVSSGNGGRRRATSNALVPVQEVLARDDVPCLVARDLGRQPLGVRPGSDMDKERGGRNRLGTPGGSIVEDEAFEPAVPPPSTIRVFNRTSMFSVASMCFTR